MMQIRLLSAALLLVLPGVDSAAATAKQPSTAAPNVEVLAPMMVPGLGRERALRVYLPPGYSGAQTRYPVLYMFDGQNLFDAATSYAGEWEVDESLNALAASAKLELIVVGVDHGAELRMRELNPWDNADHVAGEGRQTMAFIVDVVKPYIDAHYRTRPERDSTAIMGSSMGGLMSHFAILEYPQIFSKAGIFSPAYWNAPAVYEYTAGRCLPDYVKLYFYAGGSEDRTMVPNMQREIALVRERGVAAENLQVHVDPQARHNEAAWRAEFPRAVQWLFGQ